MRAKTLVVFFLSVAVCAAAASYHFYDSAHTIGLIKAGGGEARHPILLDRGRDSYTLIATATVVPPYRGDVRVAVEGEPAMDFMIYNSEPVVDLGVFRHPAFRNNVLYDLRPKDKIALWVVMKPKGSALPGHANPEQASDVTANGSCCEIPAPEAATKAEEHPTAHGNGNKDPRTKQFLAFYDVDTNARVLQVPIIYRDKEGTANATH